MGLTSFYILEPCVPGINAGPKTAYGRKGT